MKAAMEKTDFRKALGDLYGPSDKDFSIVVVPAMQFVMCDGQGDPNKSEDYQGGLNWLFTISYKLKFASRDHLQHDYVVPPLEALWWADDMRDFVEGRKEKWRWTQMIMVPDWIGKEMFAEAVNVAGKKLGAPPPSLRLEPFDEGLSVQIMHIGPYGAEAPTIKRLHEEFLPRHGLAENGLHHEIYLSDPRRTAPDKLKTVIRQPVKRM